jgi:hypothetical protein
MTYHESLLDAPRRGENIPLCQDDYEDLNRYLAQRDQTHTAFCQCGTCSEAFAAALVSESEGGYGE